MTGMDIAERLNLPGDILEAVANTPAPDILPDPEDPRKTLEQAGALAGQDNGLRILRFYLEWAAAVRERYAALGLPEQEFWDGARDIAIWAEDYREKHGVPGFAEWGWVATTLSLKVFRLGRLQFEPSRLEEDLVCHGQTYPAGTPILHVHIPAGEPLDVGAVREAMEYAPRFFQTHFQKTFVLFHCHSWLLSPQLKTLLPEDSRIIQFQNLFRVYGVDDERQAEERVFGRLEEDPAAYPEETFLQRKMKSALLAGRTFGMGCGIRPIPCPVDEKD